MTLRVLVTALTAALALSACGGGGSGSGSNVIAPMPNPGPTNAPSSTPAVQAQLLGAPGWTSPNGMTLYMFAADGVNVSHCSGACAAVWPPFMAPATAASSGNFSAIARSDGTHQWAYKGHPLYNYIGDSHAGETNGNGLNQFGGIWTVARP